MPNRYPFKLRFQAGAIRQWASRYPVEYDAEIENTIAPQVKARGYFLREEFVRLCRWKTPRSQPKIAGNLASHIEQTFGRPFVPDGETVY